MRRVIITSVVSSVFVLGATVLARPAHAQPHRGPSLEDDTLPSATEMPAVPAPAPVAPITLRDSIVALARAQLGRPYVFGGAVPQRGFDCSGLVQYVMRALGIDVPRTAAQQALIGLPVARDTAMLAPGDLLVFGSGPIIEHVGIYVGGGRFVHASSVAGRVIESPIDRPPDPLIKPWVAVRRVGP